MSERDFGIWIPVVRGDTYGTGVAKSELPDAPDVLWTYHAGKDAGFDATPVVSAGVIYLDGNSLGALPKASPAHLEAVARREWGEGLVRSWNSAGWIEAPAIGARISALVARSLPY